MSAPTPTTPTSTTGVQSAPAWPLVLVVMIILVGLGIRSFAKWWSTPTTPSPPLQVVVVEQAPPRTLGPILYKFGPDGCVIFPMRDGPYHSYPKGGSVTIYIPDGRKPVKDTPGEDSKWGDSLPDGDYRACRLDPEAWGIEIWQ